MATKSVQTIIRTGTGLTPAYTSCSGGGDVFPNAGNEVIHIKNGHSGAQTVTIVSQSTVDGLAVADRAIAIPAGEERFIGPFPQGTYNNSSGQVELTYSGVTSLTIAVLKPTVA